MTDDGKGAATGAALAEVEDQSGLPLDHRTPVMDRINPRMLELLRTSRMRTLSNAEVGMALELAVHYQLDPFAGEIWATKGEAKNGREGQLLIMVGRDGLRKIVNRNGLLMDGDVVRKNDAFRVTRHADRTRSVEHSYEGDAEKRGPIVGAWAETWDRSGGQRGFFFAPLTEYRPTNENKLRFSPWGTQESVMILAAAERQAARQATPLSGILVEGEMDLNEERAAGLSEAGTVEDEVAIQAVIDSLDAPEDLRDELYEAVQAANAVAPRSWYAGKLQVQLAGRTEAQLREDVAYIRREAEELAERARRAAEEAPEEEHIQDAEVVPEAEPEERGAPSSELEALEHTIADLEAAIDDADEGLEKEELEAKLAAAEKRRAQLAKGE